MNLLWFQPTTVASALGNETDHLALLKIKESKTNDPHEVMSSWNDSIHFCNWHGVTCSLRHQRVTTLNLKWNNLGGSISPYIGNLTFLRKLAVCFDCNISTLFVTSRLKSLSIFTTSSNKLTGTVPPSLSNMSSLTIISISQNQLNGTLPAKIGLTLPNLKYLALVSMSSLGLL
ncbi:hypothetical protein RGQ29_018464, partial [Quercus rubra]